jgi:hypothetical protein
MMEKKKRRRGPTPEEWARWRETEQRGERVRERILAEEAAREAAAPRAKRP